MRGLIIVAACILPLAALAQTDTTPAAAGSADASAGGLGSQTRLWLSTQTSGSNAVSEERPMPGEVATLVYQRYLQSFTYPIPLRFTSDSFTAAGAGGGSGGGSGSGGTP